MMHVYHGGIENNLGQIIKDLIMDDGRLEELGEFCSGYLRRNMAAELGARKVVAVYQKALSRRHSRFDFIK